MKRLCIGLGLGFLLGLSLGTAALAETGMNIKMVDYQATESKGIMEMIVDMPINRSLRDAIDGGTDIKFKIDLRLVEKGLIVNDILYKYEYFGVIRRQAYGQGYQYVRFGEQSWNEIASMDGALEDMSGLTLEFTDPGFIRNLKTNPDLYFSFRLEVDLKDLPRPLQVDLLTSESWSFSSGWSDLRP